ncbi:MAG: OsmC family protein, partial [Gammaproteobacteria bacterium]|nr:OsmC family protein [Gammaproteobacteria bacterium]
MQARVNWVEDVMFVAESGSGHAVVIDGAPEGGGRNMGMRPMELVALGVASCSSYDVVTILRKARQKITRCEA